MWRTALQTKYERRRLWGSILEIGETFVRCDRYNTQATRADLSSYQVYIKLYLVFSQFLAEEERPHDVYHEAPGVVLQVLRVYYEVSAA